MATVYRGKYPTRIESTFSLTAIAQEQYKAPSRYAARLNNGQIYGLAPTASGWDVPKCGTEISDWKDGYPVFLYQSDKRRAAS